MSSSRENSDTVTTWRARRTTTGSTARCQAAYAPEYQEGSRSADLSRKHAVLTSPDGVITVVGGKLTTYRRMAADAVNATGLTTNPCRTKDIPLVGATRAAVDAPPRLVAKYGAEAPQVAALNRPEPVFAEITEAEVAWAYEHEGALDADDVLDRRTRIGLVPADREQAAAALRA